MNEEPLSALHKLFRTSSGIRLLNVYKGLPIANDAIITAVDASSITVNSNKTQVACMFLDRETMIESPSLVNTIRAKLLQVNSEKMEVRLGNFEFASDTIGDRRQVRVVPIDPINSMVQLKNSQRMIQADLADISQNGLAIYMPRKYFSSEIYRIGSELMINFMLPATTGDTGRLTTGSLQGLDPMARFSRGSLRGSSDSNYSETSSDQSRKAKQVRPENKKVTVRGEVKNLKREIANDSIRIGMRFTATAENQAIISNFITQRQSEIVREVKNLQELLNKFTR